jgi:hypothetical protein
MPYAFFYPPVEHLPWLSLLFVTVCLLNKNIIIIYGSDRSQLVVSLINAAYYHNSYFPRSVNSYNKHRKSVKSMCDFNTAL